MKFRLPLLSAIFIVLFASVAAANDWSAVTDEIDVDYSSNAVRVFALVKSGSGDYNRAVEQSKKILLGYLGTLTRGKEKVRMEEEFNKRPALFGKVQYAVQRNIQQAGDAKLPATDQYGLYMTFDLNLLKPLIPDLNMPSQDDML